MRSWRGFRPRSRALLGRDRGWWRAAPRAGGPPLAARCGSLAPRRSRARAGGPAGSHSRPFLGVPADPLPCSGECWARFWRAAALFRQEAFVSFLKTGSWTELNLGLPRQPTRDQRARDSFMLLTHAPPQLQAAARGIVIGQDSNVHLLRAEDHRKARSRDALLVLAVCSCISIHSISRVGAVLQAVSIKSFTFAAILEPKP